MNLLEHLTFANASIELAAENGVTSYLSNDFNEMKEVHSNVRPEAVLTPLFDPDLSDIGARGGLWLKGLSEAGDVVQLQMMRCFDLGEQTLAEHLKERARDYVPPSVGNDFDMATSRFDTAPIASKISGRVVYHGGFWLAKAQRGGGFTGVFPRLLMHIAAQTWSPDYIFCYQSRELAFGGLGAKEGYSNSSELGIRWGLKSGGHLDKVILWVAKSDFPMMLSYAPSETYDILEGMRRMPKSKELDKKAAS